MSSYFNILVFALVITLFGEIKCECKQSFVTVCDTIEDFKNISNVETLTEVMIGSEHGTTNMTTVDFMHTLQIERYHNLLTLMVIRAVNRLDITTYAFQCTYYKSPLSTFILYGNVFKTIEPYHFPLFKLKKMSLVNNQIEAVKGWAFKNHEIEILDLSNNLMEVIESESLPLVDSNKKVSVRNNRLTHIEPGSFSSSLESLNLDNNKLRYIQDEVFEKLVNLKELTLSHNNFNVFPKINHLKNLVVFDMSNNAITTLRKGTFQLMDQLKLIDLSNNQITSNQVLEWINTPGKQPTLTISLALNRLEKLSLDKVSLQNQTLVLYGNPWDCNYWSQLKTKLSGHESECDIKFLSAGEVPYCINYRAGGYPFISQWDADVDRFHNTVRDSEKKAGCSLAPNRYKWLYPIGFGCVA